MKIRHLTYIKNPEYIVVRHYSNENIVHAPSNIHDYLEYKLDFELGQWKIKYKNFIPKEYLSTFEHS